MMATSTLWAVSPLEEAAAIVKAEWIRLQHENAVSDGAIAVLPAEQSAPAPSRVHVGVATTRQPSLDNPAPDDRRARPTWRPAMPVWPTQRSPPLGLRVLEGVVGQRR